MREHDVRSSDGTRIRAWRVDADGPDVLLCPGLGCAARAWPAFPARVHSWYHRGTMGSARPADESRVEVVDHVADAIAVLDEAGVRRCVVAGWSTGVTLAAELALRHPERVSGLMLVAGSAGDSFAGLPGVPAELGRLVGRSGAAALRAAGPLLDAVLHRVPLPATNNPYLEVLRPFLRNDWSWYFTLALAFGRSPRLDLTGVTCPTTVLAGRYDPLTTTSSVLGPVSGLPQARVRVLPNTHLLPLESPQLLVDELALLLERVKGVDSAVEDLALTARSRPRA